MADKIIIGTSGYSYEDWRGVFYPEDLPKGKMLDYYARFFNGVEINSTYYRIPHPAVFYQMERKTPDDFEFVVKVHQETTHIRQNNAAAMEELKEAVKPLVEANKFSGFLAQFPYSFKNIPENREYLRQTKELTGDFPLFVEFRNWTWEQPETYLFLQENGIEYVNVDQPPLRGLLPPQAVVTGNRGYVRFHGRNTREWWKGTNETRYNYLYSREELDEWLIRISHIMKKSFKTYIFFNNHPQGKAIRNASMLKEMMQNQMNILENGE